MGNCCGTTSSSSSSSVHYCGGEDRSFQVTSSGNNNNRNHKSSTNKVFDESKLTNNKDDNRLHDLLGDLTASSISRSGKIKIKMTKKELQVLLGELEKQKKNNSAEQVLVRLMEARHHRTGHNNWSPVLESIPEANSSSD